MEEDDEIGDSRAVNAAIRSAKKSAQPAKIGVPEKRSSQSSKSKAKKRRTKVTARTGGAFERDLGQKSGGEGVRAKKGDVIGGMGKKSGKRRRHT